MMRSLSRAPRGTRIALAAVTGLALACASGCGGAASTEPKATAADTAGTVRTDPGGWIEYTIGDMPLILSAPHGGSFTPTHLPNRVCSGCITGADEALEELTRRVATRLYLRTGRRPHVIINRLARVKLDPNREVVEATGGNAVTVPIWTAYHAFIDTAAARVARTHRRGLLLDLHGTIHPYVRLEIGYNLPASTLRLSDSLFNAAGAVAQSSIARLATDNAGHASGADLIWGASSLGAIFARNGYPAVPSASRRAPALDEPYYSGGYTSERHGSANGGAVDAIQVEAWRDGVRDTSANLDRYADAVVRTALEYLHTHYGWSP